jgi:hypothetical protein
MLPRGMDRGSDIGVVGPAGETDLPQPIKGDGYSLTHTNERNRWRFDVWVPGKHRVVPFTGELSRDNIEATKRHLETQFSGDALALARVGKLMRETEAMFGG